MNERQCKDCPYLGTIFKHWYGAEKEPYCEYAPEREFMRKVHRMKECPNGGPVTADEYEQQMLGNMSELVAKMFKSDTRGKEGQI